MLCHISILSPQTHCRGRAGKGDAAKGLGGVRRSVNLVQDQGSLPGAKAQHGILALDIGVHAVQVAPVGCGWVRGKLNRKLCLR